MKIKIFLKIISCLKRQRFDKKKLELIFINDHSEDKTLELLEKDNKIVVIYKLCKS